MDKTTMLNFFRTRTQRVAPVEFGMVPAAELERVKTVLEYHLLTSDHVIRENRSEIDRLAAELTLSKERERNLHEEFQMELATCRLNSKELEKHLRQEVTMLRGRTVEPTSNPVVPLSELQAANAVLEAYKVTADKAFGAIWSDREKLAARLRDIVPKLDASKEREEELVAELAAMKFATRPQLNSSVCLATLHTLISRNTVTCPISFEPIGNPVLLACHHVFESRELGKWWKVNWGRQCPVCRERSSILHGELIIPEGV